jgi:hypothetical protein
MIISKIIKFKILNILNILNNQRLKYHLQFERVTVLYQLDMH